MTGWGTAPSAGAAASIMERLARVRIDGALLAGVLNLPVGTEIRGGQVEILVSHGDLPEMPAVGGTIPLASPSFISQPAVAFGGWGL